MKSDLSVLKTSDFNDRDLLVVIWTLAFAFYSVELENIDTGLPPLFRQGIIEIFSALWHLPFVGHEMIVYNMS